MFSRREVLLAGAGLLAARPRVEPESDTGLLVAGTDGSRRAVLLGAPPGEWFDGRALEGIGARLLHRCGDFVDAEPVLALELHHGYGRIWLPGSEVACRVGMPASPSGFAVAWAFPALGIGNCVGYDADEVARLVSPPSAAQFHHLEDGGGRLPLPPALRWCRVAFMTYFGDGLKLSRLSEIARSIEARLPGSADFLFATAERPAWSPRVLLTVFD